MFKFNELSILNNKLVIDLQVEDEFEDYYIQSVSVSNQKDYNESATSGEGEYLLYNFPNNVEGIIYDETGSKEKQIDTKKEVGFTILSSQEEEIGKGHGDVISETEVEGIVTYIMKITSWEDKVGDEYIPNEEKIGLSYSFIAGDVDITTATNINDESDVFILQYSITETPIYKTMYKHIKIVLSGQEFSTATLNNYTLSDLLFIYALAQYDGEGETLPCGEKEWTVHPVVDMLPFYCRGMNFVKSLGDTCNIPREFIDYILMYKAFELSLYTGNYPNAIQYFNDFKRVKSKSGIQIKQRRGGGCGCH